MIKAGATEKGMALLMKGQPFIIVEREFVNPGKGSAFVRLKLKSPQTGQVLRETIKTQENVEDIMLEDTDCQYLYADAEAFHFMKVDTYEQFSIPLASFEGYEFLMKEGEAYRIMFYGDDPLDIKLPPKIVFEVVEAESVAKGDTVNAVTKLVKLDSGLEIRVPAFIKEGEKVLVTSDTREYVERVNK